VELVRHLPSRVVVATLGRCLDRRCRLGYLERTAFALKIVVLPGAPRGLLDGRLPVDAGCSAVSARWRWLSCGQTAAELPRLPRHTRRPLSCLPSGVSRCSWRADATWHWTVPVS